MTKPYILCNEELPKIPENSRLSASQELAIREQSTARYISSAIPSIALCTPFCTCEQSTARYISSAIAHSLDTLYKRDESPLCEGHSKVLSHSCEKVAQGIPELACRVARVTVLSISTTSPLATGNKNTLSGDGLGCLSDCGPLLSIGLFHSCH